MSTLRALLFDLDGTLVQTRSISWQIFQETNAKFGLGINSSAEFFELFEENFFAALESLARERGVAEPTRVMEHFQQNLRSDYLPEIVPGIAAIIRKLASSYTLMIVSSNTMESVRRVLEKNGLADCFAHVFSGEIAPSKLRAIGHVLDDPTYACGRQCVPYYNESSIPHRHEVNEVMLITDTVGDVAEALVSGIRVCGVAWGMHSVEQLTAAGAEFVCVWPEELLVYLQDGLSDKDSPCSLVGALAGSRAVPLSDARAAVNEAAARRRARRAGALARQAALSEGGNLATTDWAQPSAAKCGSAGGSACEPSCSCSESYRETAEVSCCCERRSTAVTPPPSLDGNRAREWDRSSELLRSVLGVIGD